MMTFMTHGTLGAVHQACYCALALVLIRDHNRRLQQHFSSLEKMNLRWLHVLSLAALAVVSYYPLSRYSFRSSPGVLLKCFFIAFPNAASEA